MPWSNTKIAAYAQNLAKRTSSNEVSTASDSSLLTVGYRMLGASVSSGRVGGTSPTLANFGPASTPQRTEYSFAVGDFDFIQELMIPNDVTPLGLGDFFVMWTTNGTNTATVKWELTISRCLAFDQAAVAAPTVVNIEEAGGGTAWQIMTTVADAGDAFTLTEPGEMILPTLRRVTNGGTDNADTVFGLYVGMIYQSNRSTTPNKVPDFYA